jgi:hypothetical protein
MTDARRAAQAWLEIYDATGYAGEACAAQLIRALLAAPPTRPAQDAVREAAERLREHVHFEDGEDGEPVAFLGSGFEEAFLALLAALDARGGAS